MPRPALWVAAAVVACAAAALTLVEREGLPLQPDFSRTPVLFVHGHGLSSQDWRALMDYLERRGYPPEYLSAIDIRPSRMANVEAAEKFIAPAVDALLRQAQDAARRAGRAGAGRRVDLVAHSMGAVSSRWYAARMHPERVRVWLSVAGSNHGTNALCNHTDPGAADMCPAYAESAAESRVQALLNGVPGEQKDESPFGVGPDPGEVRRVPPDGIRSIHYFTIRVEPDEWLEPPVTATLAGAGGVDVELPRGADIRETSPGNFRTYRDLDHMSILEDDGVHRLCLALLTTTPAD